MIPRSNLKEMGSTYLERAHAWLNGTLRRKFISPSARKRYVGQSVKLTSRVRAAFESMRSNCGQIKSLVQLLESNFAGKCDAILKSGSSLPSSLYFSSSVHCHTFQSVSLRTASKNSYF